MRTEAIKTFENEEYKLVIEYTYDTENPLEYGDGSASEIFTHDEMDAYAGSIAFKLPLYRYEHSGVAYSTKPFSCRWDSGQVGFVVVTKEKINELGLEGRTQRELEKMVDDEIEVYSQWANGDVVGFTLSKKVKCDCCNHTELEVIDSCNGFYGYDYDKNGLFETIDLNKDDLNKLIKKGA